MDIEDIKTELNKSFRYEFCFISGYRCLQTLGMFYISTKMVVCKGDLIIFFNEYLKLINIGNSEIFLIKYEEILNIH